MTKVVSLFKGFTKEYYFRQLFFALLLFFVYIFFIDGRRDIGLIVFWIINTLLYPYARFAYESIVGLIIGKNVFYVNALYMLVIKFFTMLLCWALAIFIAPIGLLFVYFYQRKKSKENASE